jgi:hypothetical protein
LKCLEWPLLINDLDKKSIYGGEAGIRTLGGDQPSTVFKTAAFDRSATSPQGAYNNRPDLKINFLLKRDICAVTLSRFTGEKGADISSQNIFLDDTITRHLPILSAEYRQNSSAPVFRQYNPLAGAIGMCWGTPQYEFNPFVESAEPASASARRVPPSHGLAP